MSALAWEPLIVKNYWTVMGCSWKGRTTLRDGRSVTCGHRHKSVAACGACVRAMRKKRPGVCQDYRVAHIQLVGRRAG